MKTARQQVKYPALHAEIVEGLGYEAPAPREGFDEFVLPGCRSDNITYLS